MFKYYKIFLASIFYVISIFFYNYSSYMDYKQKEIEVVDDKLKIGAYTVYNILGEDFFKKAINKDSISQEEDWENINKLSYYNNHANLAFIYSSIKKDNKVYLTSSSASKEELEEKSELHYFHHYEDAGESLVNSFESKEILYDNYTDKWSSFRAVHIPMTLENSQVIVISAEVSMEVFNKIIDDIKYKYLEETLLYLLLTLPIIFTTYLSIKEKTLENIMMEHEVMRSEKMAALGEMIANIAHQWRQPLSVISTGVTGMKIQKEYGILNDEEFDKTCQAINDNAQYLSKTIDHFSDFIKGERNKVVFDIADNINNFLTLVQGSIKIHNINIVLDLEENIKINNYPNELLQCLFNIFNNAKDALIEKKVENKYVFISSKIKKNHVIIKIKDNAHGIANSVLPHIFEPYFTTKDKSKGTGLGLNITYNLVTKGMDGSMEAYNVSFTYNKNEYAGAEFRIELPYE
ncbi:signal transduction sensor histidine kinase [Arcobacter acticola]|uniref:histidine kinase n=1 Tax=Arcobacter acticola TaxID=1849015 RepID=A0A6M8EMP7_9BACT|nr:HAMP domain-containing sensor histidine kinase [Arcobacter acticola]QKE29828.1 signal transduction sensor histidine kinase [Arcobacter acticola]